VEDEEDGLCLLFVRGVDELHLSITVERSSILPSPIGSSVGEKFCISQCRPDGDGNGGGLRVGVSITTGMRKTGCAQYLREGLMSSIYRSRWNGAPFVRRHLDPQLERNFIAHSALEELF
jgi:hypothetical protein